MRHPPCPPNRSDRRSKAVPPAIRKLLRAVPEPFRKTAEGLAKSIDYQVDPSGVREQLGARVAELARMYER